MTRWLLCKLGRHNLVMIAFAWHEWYRLTEEEQREHLFCFHCGKRK